MQNEIVLVSPLDIVREGFSRIVERVCVQFPVTVTLVGSSTDLEALRSRLDGVRTKDLGPEEMPVAIAVAPSLREGLSYDEVNAFITEVTGQTPIINFAVVPERVQGADLNNEEGSYITGEGIKALLTPLLTPYS